MKAKTKYKPKPKPKKKPRGSNELTDAPCNTMQRKELDAPKIKKKRKYAERVRKIDVEVLYKKCFNYLLTNFGKFTQANKIKVALKLTEKYIDSTIKKDNEGGDTYYTNIINNFKENGNLTNEERHRISERMGSIREHFSKG